MFVAPPLEHLFVGERSGGGSQVGLLVIIVTALRRVSQVVCTFEYIYSRIFSKSSCIFLIAPQMGHLCDGGTLSTPICAEPWMPERAKVASLLKRLSPKARAVSSMARPIAKQRPSERSPTLLSGRAFVANPSGSPVRAEDNSTDTKRGTMRGRSFLTLGRLNWSGSRLDWSHRQG